MTGAGSDGKELVTQFNECFLFKQKKTAPLGAARPKCCALAVESYARLGVFIMTEKERKIKAAYRLEIVTAYLYGNISVTEFTDLYNAGKIFNRLGKKTGAIEADDLDRWVNTCMGVLDEEKVF